MANKNNTPKTPKSKAPAANAASETKQTPASTVENAAQVANQFGKMAGGLDPNHQVELLGILNERFFKDPEAAKHTGFPQEQIYIINEITACGAVSVLASEIVHGNSDFALRMRPTQLEHITSVCSAMGININAAALPAPGDDGTVLLPATAVEVSDETAEQIKKEEAAAAVQTVTDPTKITSEEELIAALNKIMIDRVNTYQKVNDALNFYIAYKKFVASKAENKDEALKLISETSRIDLLKEMAKLVGACPLVLNGVGRYMYTVTATSKSPIAAFCSFRNTTKNKKTGTFAISDEEVADYVRTLIEWSTDLKRETETKKIADHKANLEILMKDEKKNAKAIEDVKSKIEACETNMTHFDDVLEYINNASSTVPATLIELYDQKDMDAQRTFKAITGTYYDDIELKDMKLDGVKANVEKYAGIITNYFRQPGAKLEGYHLSDIRPLEPIGEVNNEAGEGDSKKD